MNGGQSILLIAIMSLCSMALMALEAFVPGISPAGIAAAALIAWSTYLCWSAFGPLAGIALLLVSAGLAFVIMKVVLRSMKKGRLSKTDLFLHPENSPVVPVPAQHTSVVTGAVGVSVTALRPSGIAEIGGERIHVSADGSFIEANAEVRVVRIEGARIFVVPCRTDEKE